MLYMVAGPSPRLHICSKHPSRLVVGAYLVSREMDCPIFLASQVVEVSLGGDIHCEDVGTMLRFE
jgi:hypothetical protein